MNMLNDDKAIEFYRKLGLEEGGLIQADTHADFLNSVFHTNYKAWMKSAWNILETNGEMFVWLVLLDGKNRNGWKNIYKGDVIEEINIDEVDFYDGENIEWRNRKRQYRIVVQVLKDKGKRVYKILGLYKFSEESTKKTHIINKIY